MSEAANAHERKPLLLYDGDCGFCKRWVTRWRNATGDAIDYEPFQDAADRFPHIPRESFEQSVHLIEPDGRVSKAARAAVRSLALGGCCRWLAWSYEHVPGFAFVAEMLYRFVARWRGELSYVDRFFFGRKVVPIRYALTRSIFLRLLGVVYFAAFASLWVQMDGLFGSGGILPASEYLQRVHDFYGGAAYWRLPTLAWINSSDASLHAMCVGGMVLSILLTIGLAPLPILAILWALYLSLAHLGQVFLGYQWDALLLETGFLAILFAPRELWLSPSRTGEPSRLVVFMFRWLTFRLMFYSGVVKLMSGDPAWRDWTALNYHYESQPLPTWTSWYAHHFSPQFQSMSVGVMFFIELFVPILMLLPRRMRLMAFWLTVLLQVAIALTGNYGYFNVLALVLCITLLDDHGFSAPCGAAFNKRSGSRVRAFVVAPICIFLFLISLTQLTEAFNRSIVWPAPIATVREAVAPISVINSYGLFAVMTTSRPEIIVEGSDDGVTWKAYEFKWKPGDLSRAPAFVTPHMPRLDWQMWFAAIYGLQDSVWFEHFVEKLLDNAPAVTSLLERNPFPDAPPKYIRATLYDYHFTTAAQRAATGAWWNREYLGMYCPRVSKETFERN